VSHDMAKGQRALGRGSFTAQLARAAPLIAVGGQKARSSLHHARSSSFLEGLSGRRHTALKPVGRALAMMAATGIAHARTGWARQLESPRVGE
jgi:hypothetical protein